MINFPYNMLTNLSAILRSIYETKIIIFVPINNTIKSSDTSFDTMQNGKSLYDKTEFI